MRSGRTNQEVRKYHRESFTSLYRKVRSYSCWFSVLYYDHDHHMVFLSHRFWVTSEKSICHRIMVSLRLLKVCFRTLLKRLILRLSFCKDFNIIRIIITLKIRAYNIYVFFMFFLCLWFWRVSYFDSEKFLCQPAI